MTRPVNTQGFYEDRGTVFRTIGQLMAVNDNLFEIQKTALKGPGLVLDFHPLFVQISDMIDQLRTAVDG